MALSRKRQRELSKLRHAADDLRAQQRETLEQAAHVLREARRQAGNYAREEVRPRVSETYYGRVRPAFESGYAASRHAARATRTRFSDDVVPAVSGAVGSALAVVEAARDSNFRELVRRSSKSAAPIVIPKKSNGPGRYIVIGLGVVAALGVAYAAWQTLRIDEDLWIEDVGEVDASEPEDEDEF